MAELLASFPADRATYIRTHVFMAVIFAVGAAVILQLAGNPYPWVGFIAGPAAMAVRGWYLASEELPVVWELSDQLLTGPGERRIPVSSIAKARTLGTAVQVVTGSGDKHLMKYMANPAKVVAEIERARLT